MIKFFRKIRQQSFDKGKIKNYLLYALGEILLVMIGILFALQVNNWNAERKNNNAEFQLLKDLNQEFQLNQTILSKKLNDVNKGIDIHSIYIEKLISGQQTFEDMVGYQEDLMFGLGTSDPVYGVINSLISSGEIRLVRNDSLKYELTSWKDKMADLFENEKLHLNFAFKYSDYVDKRIPRYVNLKNSNVGYYDFSQKKMESLYLTLAKDLQYRNFVIVNSSYLEYQIKPELKTVLNACEKIIQLISKETDE